MSGYISTHSMGKKCQKCGGVLVEDNCKCGNRHGYTYQQPGTYASETHPDHPCFQSTEEGTDDRAR